MKKFYRNSVTLTLALIFSALNFTVERAAAQVSGVSVKPKPKAQSTPKKTADAKNKPTPKPADVPKSTAKTGEQIIVTGTNVVVWKEASTKSTRLTAVKLGKILPVVKRGSSFYQVEYEDGKDGWISTTFTRDYDADKRDSLYREIGDKQLKNPKINFTIALETTEFLRTAQALVRTDEARADLSFKRLRYIAAALKAIPSGKGEKPLYKNFIRANEKDIVYSEPSAEWYVRAESLWDLREKFSALPVAEEIARTAANTPIPGECEGYINCYLYNIRAADGEYLNFYPNGKYAQKSLTNIGSYLEPLVADIKEKTVYTPPTDISDRAEFNRFLTELRSIISKVPNIEKNKILKQINQLGEGYK